MYIYALTLKQLLIIQYQELVFSCWYIFLQVLVLQLLSIQKMYFVIQNKSWTLCHLAVTSQTVFRILRQFPMFPIYVVNLDTSLIIFMTSFFFFLAKWCKNYLFFINHDWMMNTETHKQTLTKLLWPSVHGYGNVRRHGIL